MLRKKPRKQKITTKTNTDNIASEDSGTVEVFQWKDNESEAELLKMDLESKEKSPQLTVSADKFNCFEEVLIKNVTDPNACDSPLVDASQTEPEPKTAEPIRDEIEPDRVEREELIEDKIETVKHENSSAIDVCAVSIQVPVKPKLGESQNATASSSINRIDSDVVPVKPKLGEPQIAAASCTKSEVKPQNQQKVIIIKTKSGKDVKICPKNIVAIPVKSETKSPEKSEKLVPPPPLVKKPPVKFIKIQSTNQKLNKSTIDARRKIIENTIRLPQYFPKPIKPNLMPQKPVGPEVKVIKTARSLIEPSDSSDSEPDRTAPELALPEVIDFEEELQKDVCFIDKIRPLGGTEYFKVTHSEDKAPKVYSRFKTKPKQLNSSCEVKTEPGVVPGKVKGLKKVGRPAIIKLNGYNPTVYNKAVSILKNNHSTATYIAQTPINIIPPPPVIKNNFLPQNYKYSGPKPEILTQLDPIKNLQDVMPVYNKSTISTQTEEPTVRHTQSQTCETFPATSLARSIPEEQPDLTYLVNYLLGNPEYSVGLDDDKKSDLLDMSESLMMKFAAPVKTVQPISPVQRPNSLKMQLFLDLKECMNYDRLGNLPIHNAVMENHIIHVKRQCFVLKLRQAPVDLENNERLVPLQIAVLNNCDTDVIKTLLEYKSDPNVRDSRGNTLIHLAVENSTDYNLDLLLKTCPAKAYLINLKNDEGVTPLILAAMYSKADMVEALLQNGADPNLRDEKSGRTALFHAVETNSTFVISLLLRFKADPKIRNFFGLTAVDAARDLDIVTDSNLLQLTSNCTMTVQTRAAAIQNESKKRHGRKRYKNMVDGPDAVTGQKRSKLSFEPVIQKIDMTKMNEYRPK